jgi:hypothetical protein
LVYPNPLKILTLNCWVSCSVCIISCQVWRINIQKKQKKHTLYKKVVPKHVAFTVFCYLKLFVKNVCNFYNWLGFKMGKRARKLSSSFSDMIVKSFYKFVWVLSSDNQNKTE